MLSSISLGGGLPTTPLQNAVAPAQGQAAPVAAPATSQSASSPTQGSQTANASQGLLTATYVPSATPAGGTYKVVEKSTGQVVVELPQEITLSQGAGAGKSSGGVDLTA